MNTITGFLLPLLIVAPATLFPQTRIDGATRHDRPITPFTFLSLPQASDGLAKSSTAHPESTVVTGIETYDWNDSDWTTGRAYVVSYESYGRLAGYRLDPPQTTPVYHTEETLLEYDDINNIIRKLEYSTDSSAAAFGKSEGSTDFYCNTRSLPGISRQPFIALPNSQILPATGPAFDSVKFFFSVWDPAMNGMASSDLYKYTYTYDDTAVRVINWSQPADSDSIKIDGRHEYRYRFTESGKIDSIIHSSANDSGAYTVTDLYQYAYSAEKLSSITYSTNNMLSIYYYNLTYNPQGRLSSYTEQYSSDVVTTRANISKVTYTYSTIPTVAIATAPRRRITAGFHAERVRNCLRLTAPGGESIIKVALFDLRGRCIKSLAIPGTPENGMVRFPLPANGTGLRIVRVTTNRGVFNLPIGPAGVWP